MSADYFSDRLRELRTAAGLTQEQLANQAGIAHRSVIYLESGTRSPSWEAAISLANALGIGIEEFTRKPRSTSRRKRGRPKNVG